MTPAELQEVGGLFLSAARWWWVAGGSYVVLVCWVTALAAVR